MSTDMNDKAEIQDRLWSELKKVRYGMLGVVGAQPAQHFQPMTAFAEKDEGAIWFFTRRDTDIAKAALGASRVMFIVQAKDQEFQACIGGRLVQAFDRARVEKYWNPIVAAWYPQGKDDPGLTLLRMDATDAQVWVSQQNPVMFAYEITKANLTHREPDVGASATVDLNARPGA